ncbi:hypothetical protein N7478_000791 [Penicillium angulare]|uniref:uncharacterized protein n=1 Tax=Penicillium angulare TaxID=116970 RepID=UPI00253FDB6D|nr:uncharacterized protein N7478_000791 [Penicillium angulare]KAJ5291540.1 hypothetical protein N7478_000791 [Penicillium angulare]
MSKGIYSEELRAVPQDQRLRSEGQWRVWIGHMRSAALAEDVWNYLNPDLPEEKVRQVPEAAEEPKPSTIREDVEDEFDLTEKEYTQWTRRIQAHDRREAQRVRLLKVMARMNSLITRSLASEYHYLTVDEVSPYQKLVRLAREFKPKPETRTEELRAAWRAMIKQPANNVDINHWLTEWKNLYEEGLAADVPDIAHGVNYAIRDFLRAVQPIDDIFASSWMDKILTQKVTFQEVASAYRTRRMTYPLQRVASNDQLQRVASDEYTYQTRCPCGNAQHHYSQ